MWDDIDPSWKPFFEQEVSKPYCKELISFIENEYQNQVCFPPKEAIFRIFKTNLEDIKVVILGQDPYHGPNQANGYAFAVHNGTPIPPSLRNIIKELQTDVGTTLLDTSLEPWVDQGVFLLNATLTVRAQKAGSHQKKGWETFTNQVLQKISSQNKPIVFILWGTFAQKKQEFITGTQHKIILSAHPSPLSVYRGFWNSKPFSATNTFLISKNIKPINW